MQLRKFHDNNRIVKAKTFGNKKEQTFYFQEVITFSFLFLFLLLNQ